MPTVSFAPDTKPSLADVGTQEPAPKYSSLCFTGPSGGYSQAEALRDWLESANPGDLSLLNLSILPRNEFISEEGKPTGSRAWTDIRFISASDQENFAKSLGMETLSWASNRVSLKERNEELQKLAEEDDRLKPDARVVLDDAKDPMWQDSDSVALSFHSFVKTDGDDWARPHYHVIPIKPEHVSKRVKRLQRRLRSGGSIDETGGEESESSMVDVVSLLGPTMETLNQRIDKKREHAEAVSKRLSRQRASLKELSKSRKSKGKGKAKATKDYEAAQNIADSEAKLAKIQADIETLEQIHRAVEKHFPPAESKQKPS